MDKSTGKENRITEVTNDEGGLSRKHPECVVQRGEKCKDRNLLNVNPAFSVKATAEDEECQNWIDREH